MKKTAHLIAILGALALTGVVIPDEANAQERPPDLLGADWKPIDPQRLDGMRGGFNLPSGLNLSFGIERAVYVNGALVANASLNIADIGSMTQDEADALQAIAKPLVVQIGPGNTFDPSSMAGSGVGGLVIQNSLDGQDIRAITTVTAGVDTLGMFQDLNTTTTLQNALLSVPGAP